MIRRLLMVGISLSGLVSAATDTRVAGAAERSDLALVRTLVSQKADVNGAQGDGMTALHWAASRDDLAMAKVLIAAGANPKADTRLGAITPLFMAARTGSAPMVQALVAAGADVNAADATGVTPLMAAAASGGAAAVKVLLDHRANPNAKENAREQTALMFAAAKNRGAAIRVLMARGANAKLATKVTPVERVRFDPDLGVIPDEPPPAAKPPADAPAAVQSASAQPPAGNGRGGQVYGGGGGGGGRGGPRREFGATSVGGTTALLYAARDGMADAVKALVESGAEVDQTSESEKLSPMLMAIVNGHFDVAKYLLDRGADPNLVNQHGLTPLYAALDVQWSPHAWYPEPVVAQEQADYLTLMKALIAHGANVNARLDRKPWFRTTSHDATWVDPAGATAFWRAAQATDIDAMKLLVAAGADPKIASTDGDTPLTVAAGLGWGWNFSVGAPDAWIGATKYLLDLGLDVNAADSKGYTPLHGASYVGDNTLVRLLVDRGADVKAVAKDSNTVADMANGPNRFGIPHPETVALLEKLGSANSHNCRSDQCLVAPMPDRQRGPQPAQPAVAPAVKPPAPYED